jgi:CDP-glucose 4,6-dehydratase
MEKGDQIVLRNPYSTRPYQHVLEPVTAYLMLAAMQIEEPALAGNYNVGPDDSSCVNTGALADLFCEKWGNGASWKNVSEQNAPHEANFLKLDCSRIKSVLGWVPKWSISDAVEKTVEWSKAYLSGADTVSVMENQIMEYIGE